MRDDYFESAFQSEEYIAKDGTIKEIEIKKLLFMIMSAHFEDDRTFSVCPIDYAIVNIMSKTGEIEAKLIDRRYYFEQIQNKAYVLVDMLGLRPLIYCKE